MSELMTAIVDDHPIVIEGLKALLSNETNLKIVAGFCSGEPLLSYLAGHQLDLILLDITLPDINGIELCHKVKEISLSTKILILSNHTERSIIMQAIQNGASGYLLKNSSINELRHCIAEAIEGRICYSREVMEIISRPTKNGVQETPRLTRREKEILALIASGKTSQVIAQELFLSPLTVDTHRKNLIQKFGVKNIAELVMVAVQQQLL
ncbi:response regulator transcription factor [Mucilaginibacter sp. RS28]|uniref:Response regulator transcription factor n=1 Tax=Mucilaginibacter straminoryzae TaxID=2932774 RepID=A0A9X1X2Q0_9SPHI|nr:response regulator transcription factor [Mucilaginibacter straminoryzae]MCJ8209771.1 response regulator transcription factor [Mucilaginibacter straminoryzae]